MVTYSFFRKQTYLQNDNDYNNIIKKIIIEIITIIIIPNIKANIFFFITSNNTIAFCIQRELLHFKFIVCCKQT